MTCHDNISRRHCHVAMMLMNKLIPNFEERAKAAKNINSFCAPVRLSTVFIHSSQLT
jgi:hypothetical protein